MKLRGAARHTGGAEYGIIPDMKRIMFAVLALCGVAGVLAFTACRSGGAADPSPKYAWRGYMLDVSRHFFTVDEIKRTLDLMHEHGLNVFHWHLTDHNGWRLEIDRYPKLTSVGSVRKASSKRSSTMFLDVVDGDYGPYFYTKEQVRDIVRYAAARGIRIVPEIDIPGHSGAAISAYPELGCTGIGNCSELCLGKESTFEMYENILDAAATSARVRTGRSAPTASRASRNWGSRAPTTSRAGRRSASRTTSRRRAAG